MQEPILSTKGKNTLVRLYENRIEYERTGLGGMMMHGVDGVKTIFIKDITAIQFRANFFIQFAYPGSIESKKGAFAAATDENSIIFGKRENSDFEKIRDFIISKK